jgi:hypothetical protein
MKTPAGRAKKIAALVSMLARGETIVPESSLDVLYALICYFILFLGLTY